MAPKQINAHVIPRIKKRFGDYATKNGLDDSVVAKLLILRERELRRLQAFARTRDLPGLSRQRRGKSLRASSKVTIHMSSATEVRKFHDYAVNDCGMSRSKAAAWLITKELEERWLERVIRAE
jgi:hypothetical protein